MSVATLVTRYAVDDKYTGPSRRIVSAAREVGQALDHSKRSAGGAGGVMSGLSGIMNSLSGAFSGLKSAMGTLGPIFDTIMAPLRVITSIGLKAGLVVGGLTAAVLGLGYVASQKAADIEALRLGLQAMLGTAEATDAAMARMRDVARLPGLGYEEAIQGTTSLLASGFDLNAAERAIRAFGNALATVGKGREDLNGVLIALSQIATKGKVSAEEILQLAERVPQIRRVMMEAFGTADTEQLAKMGVGSDVFLMRIISELEKLPKVAGGAKNTWSDFWDSMTIGLARVGDSVNAYLMPVLSKVIDWVNYIAESGVLTKFVDRLLQVMGAGTGGLTDSLDVFMAKLTAFMSNLPKVVAAVVDWIQTATANLVNMVQNLISGFFDRLASGARKMADMLPWWMGGRADDLRGFADSMSEASWMAQNPGSVLSMGQQGLDVMGLGTAGWQDILKGFGGRATGTPGAPTGGTIAGPATEGGAASHLGNIDRWTRATAENTKKAIDWTAHIFGGGDLGRMGVTPVEVSKLKGGGRTVTVNAPSSPALILDPQAYIIDVLSKMGIQASRGPSMTGAR